MKRIVPFALVIFFGIAAPLSAQTVTEQKPTEAETAANKRRAEILRHPTGFITLRLAASGREPATTPPPYTADEWMRFQTFISLASVEDLTYGYSRNRCYAYRPELIRDGDILSYSKEAQECVERAERQPWG